MGLCSTNFYLSNTWSLEGNSSGTFFYINFKCLKRKPHNDDVYCKEHNQNDLNVVCNVMLMSVLPDHFGC